VVSGRAAHLSPIRLFDLTDCCVPLFASSLVAVGGLLVGLGVSGCRQYVCAWMVSGCLWALLASWRVGSTPLLTGGTSFARGPVCALGARMVVWVSLDYVWDGSVLVSGLCVVAVVRVEF